MHRHPVLHNASVSLPAAPARRGRAWRWALGLVGLGVAGVVSAQVPHTVASGTSETASSDVTWSTLGVSGTYTVGDGIAPSPPPVTVETQDALTVAAGGVVTVSNNGALNVNADFSNQGTVTNHGQSLTVWNMNDVSTLVVDNLGALTNTGFLYLSTAQTTGTAVPPFVNSGTVVNSGEFIGIQATYSTKYTPIHNSGSFSLLPGNPLPSSVLKVGTTATNGFVNGPAGGAAGQLLVTATDGPGQMMGWFQNNAGSVIELAPAAGLLQTFAAGGSGTGVNAIIDGAGALNKTSAGTTVFAMAMPYTGPTTVQAGTLLVNVPGQIVSPSTVQSGATLGGSGSVGPVTALSGGIVSPGDPLPGGQGQMGTLYATGNVLLNASSSTLFELAAPTAATPTAGAAVTAGDLVAITGDLAMNGTLKIAPQTGFAEGAYKIFSYTGALTNGATLDASALQPLGLQAQLVTTVAGEVWLFITKAPAPQTISYSSTPPIPAVVGAPYTAVATATSGLPVALTSTTPTVCTVDAAGVVSLLAPGTCSLAADQAGDSAWLAAPQVLQSFVVTAAPVITPPVVTTGPAPVPTMHPLALALMGLLAALVGGRALRRRTV